MQEVVAPLAKFLDLKCKRLQARTGLIQEHQELVDKLACARSIEEANALRPSIDRLEDTIDEASQAQAFKSNGGQAKLYAAWPLITVTRG